MNIYLDIETIPSQREDIKSDIAETISHPGNISKAETIEKWNAEKKPAAIDSKLRETALGGTFGEIICICWAIDESPVHTHYRKHNDTRWENNELGLLSEFFTEINADLSHPQRPLPAKWIGHNITGFDLRFIWQRAVIQQVPPPFNLPYDAKAWDDSVFDTMHEWAGSQGKDKSLDKVCKALGLKGKGDMDGSKVYDAWLAGEDEKIKEYCADDVSKVRDIHNMLTFNA